MKRILLVMTAAASLAALSGTATAAKPTAGATLTIAAKPVHVTFGGATTITGALSTKQTGVPLVLEANPFPFSGKWTAVGTPVNTTTDGAYSFTTVPLISTHYRVTTQDKPAVTSPEAAVGVKWRVGLGVSDLTPKKGTRVRFSGTVKPANTGAIVYIQKRTATGWKNVKQTTLVATATPAASRYSVRLRIRSNGRYRAVVLAANGYETGISRVRRLVVHSPHAPRADGCMPSARAGRPAGEHADWPTGKPRYVLARRPARRSDGLPRGGRSQRRTRFREVRGACARRTG